MENSSRISKTEKIFNSISDFVATWIGKVLAVIITGYIGTGALATWLDVSWLMEVFLVEGNTAVVIGLLVAYLLWWPKMITLKVFVEALVWGNLCLMISGAITCDQQVMGILINVILAAFASAAAYYEK